MEGRRNRKTRKKRENMKFKDFDKAAEIRMVLTIGPPEIKSSKSNRDRGMELVNKLLHHKHD